MAKRVSREAFLDWLNDQLELLDAYNSYLSVYYQAVPSDLEAAAAVRRNIASTLRAETLREAVAKYPAGSLIDMSDMVDEPPPLGEG